MSNLGLSNPEMNDVWRDEAQKRWQAYQAGELKTISYYVMMQKYQCTSKTTIINE